MEPINDTRVYAVKVERTTYFVRARSPKQAVSFIARQADRNVRDLATTSIAGFDDGVEAERLGIAVQDATTADEDSHQLGLLGG